MNFPDISEQIKQVASGYSYNKPPEFLSVFQDMLERVLRVIADLLDMLNIHVPALTDSRSVSNLMHIILVLIGIGCFIALIFAVSLRIRQIRFSEERMKTLGATTNILLTSEDWQRESENLAAQGQWREACRALYFALLRLLDEREILKFSPTRTNYEYSYALVRRKELADGFKKLVGVVEATWFGNYQANQEDFDRCKALVAKLTKSLDTREEKTN
ncbi:MAG TPA: DUF4129 domain-containing protein [Oculatellaceae cyanobacterium]